MLLVYYVQRSLFRRWAIVGILAWSCFAGFGLVEQPWILVVGAGGTLVAGVAAFSEAFQPSRTLLVGGDGIDVDTFLTTTVRHWL